MIEDVFYQWNCSKIVPNSFLGGRIAVKVPKNIIKIALGRNLTAVAVTTGKPNGNMTDPVKPKGNTTNPVKPKGNTTEPGKSKGNMVLGKRNGNMTDLGRPNATNSTKSDAAKTKFHLKIILIPLIAVIANIV